MFNYHFIKFIHVFAACFTILGFVLRAVWSLAKSPLLTHKTTKILPHLIDTLLFISGFFLMIQSRYYPTDHPWMAMKFLSVILYIISGFYVLRWARTNFQKTIGLCLGLILLTYIILLAVFKHLFFY